MKQCDYCAKEISYHEMYCCDECEEKAQNYYRLRVNIQKVISICNILGTVSIAASIFLFPLQNVLGASLALLGFLLTGLITVIVPTPTDNIISKHKLKKAMKLVRIFGFVILAFAIAALVLLLSRIF